MITENEVVQTLSKYLTHQGYRITTQLTTLEQGIDIDALHIESGRRLLIEAKGGTSSKPGTARYGEQFSSNQVKSHVAKAFYCAAKMLQEFAPERARVGLAFPDDENHRRTVDAITASLSALEITVYFIDSEGQICELLPRKP